MTDLFSLRLIISSLLQTNSAYRRLALISAVGSNNLPHYPCYSSVFLLSALGKTSAFGLLNISSIVSLIICSIMTTVASISRGWFLLTIVYSYALINLEFASFMPDEFITHWEARPELMAQIDPGCCSLTLH
jgi:ABC-type uncharacterized transport system permease subunit